MDETGHTANALLHQQCLELTTFKQRSPSTGEYSRWSAPMIFADVAQAKEALYTPSKRFDNTKLKHRTEQQSANLTRSSSPIRPHHCSHPNQWQTSEETKLNTTASHHQQQHDRNHDQQQQLALFPPQLQEAFKAARALLQHRSVFDACVNADPILASKLRPLLDHSTSHRIVNDEQPSLFVSNLAEETTVTDLNKLFSSILGDDALIDIRLTSRSDGEKFRTAFAFVDVDDVSFAENAMLLLNDHKLNGRKMHISWAKTKKMKS